MADAAGLACAVRLGLRGRGCRMRSTRPASLRREHGRLLMRTATARARSDPAGPSDGYRATPAAPDRSSSHGARLPPNGAEPEVGGGLDLPLDGGRPAVPRRSARPLFASHCRVVRAGHDDGAARDPGAPDSGLATCRGSNRYIDALLGPRQSIHERGGLARTRHRHPSCAGMIFLRSADARTPEIVVAPQDARATISGSTGNDVTTPENGHRTSMTPTAAS